MCHDSVVDSQKLEDVLDKSDTGTEVWAESAYRPAEMEAKLEAQGYKSRVYARAARNRPLTQRAQSANMTRSHAYPLSSGQRPLI